MKIRLKSTRRTIGAGGSWLIDRASQSIDGVMVYDFSIPRLFWVSASVVSMLLAASLWKVKAEE